MGARPCRSRAWHLRVAAARVRGAVLWLRERCARCLRTPLLWHLLHAIPTACDAAIDECFANGWIQVLTEQAIQGIVHALKSNGTVPGNPLHTYSSLFQFPDCADGIGCVDFTRNGAQVYLDLLAQRTRCWDPHDAWGAWDVLDSRDPVLLVAYGESEAAIDRLTESLLREDCEWIQPRAQPEPMGRWCAQWWRCFETGVRVELTAKFTPQARINYSLDDDDRNCVTV